MVFSITSVQIVVKVLVAIQPELVRYVERNTPITKHFTTILQLQVTEKPYPLVLQQTFLVILRKMQLVFTIIPVLKAVPAELEQQAIVEAVEKRWPTILLTTTDCREKNLFLFAEGHSASGSALCFIEQTVFSGVFIL